MNKNKLIIFSIICILLFSFSFYYISFNKGKNNKEINKKDEPVIKDEKDDKKDEETPVIDNTETKDDKQEITETNNNTTINDTNTTKETTNNTKKSNTTSTNKNSTTKKSNTNTTKSTSQNNTNHSSSTTQQNNNNTSNNTSNNNNNNTSTTTPQTPTTPTITYSCPNGYTLNGTKCTTTVDASLVCPDNTTESTNDSCINLSEGYESQSEECPSGYIMIKMIGIGIPDKYMCHPAHSKVYRCESGYTLSNNKCTKTIDATQN